MPDQTLAFGRPARRHLSGAMLPGTMGVAMARIRDRLSVFRKILWAPLLAIFVFLYGVAGFVAWLLKESGHAESRVTAWVPTFSWSAWIIGFLLLMLAMALEGAYKVIVKQREQIRDLNHILRHGLHYHQLVSDADGDRYSVAQVGDHLDQARATIASSLANFLAQDDPHRLRTCANSGCREVFIDRSPTGRRRWCDMRICGNRAKVAAHRSRARSLPAEAAAH